MAEANLQNDEISFFALGTTLVRSRRRIVRWMFLGAVIAAILATFKPVLYEASASFVPQGGDASRMSLTSIAGQFGVSLPGGNQTFPPEFYSELLKSRVTQLPVVRSTFVVPEMGGKRISFLQLFEIKGAPMPQLEDQGVKQLASMVTASVDKNTGVVEFSVATKWRSVSLAIITALLDGVNNFNASTKQGQAAAERQFLDGRLTVASDDLREAENRLERFLQANRDLGSSPELMLEQQRLQRDISLHEEVFTSLNQAYDDARLRELRNTPVITVFEPPSVPALPKSRHRLIAVLLGFLLGGFVGVLLVFTSETMSRYKGNAEADEFLYTLHEMKGEWRRLAFWRN